MSKLDDILFDHRFKSKKKLETDIKSLMQDIIGKDERGFSRMGDRTEAELTVIRIRNSLRGYQRKKVEEL